MKQATLSYEDEKFSYIAASRTIGLPIQGRVVRHPQIRPGHIHLQLCTPEGLKSTIVTRKDKEAFREARDIVWGDALKQPCYNGDSKKTSFRIPSRKMLLRLVHFHQMKMLPREVKLCRQQMR